MNGEINFIAAWIGICLGLLSGIFPGLMFHKANWMGGYDSWRRRLARLGHISFFGTAFLNIAFASSAHLLPLTLTNMVAAILFIAGAFTMPLICYLCVWMKAFRFFFFIPVLNLTVGSILTLIAVI